MTTTHRGALFPMFTFIGLLACANNDSEMTSGGGGSGGAGTGRARAGACKRPVHDHGLRLGMLCLVALHDQRHLGALRIDMQVSSVFR